MSRQLAALVAIIAVAVGFVHLDPAGSPAAAQDTQIGRVRDSYQPLDGKIYVLIIGTDARSGNPERGSASGPDINADGIHIAAMNLRTMRGGILNFPRDSWVAVPGRGSARINDALDKGGPELLVQTVENLTGIRLDYWVMTGFEGFQRALEDLGGVEMDVPSSIVDPGGSGANLSAGRQNLKGYQALAYMRARKPFSDGDVTRTTNHGRLLVALLQKLRGEVSRNPASLLRWLSVAREHTRYTLSEEELFRLALVTSQMKPGRVKNVTVPSSLGTVGSAEVVFISPGARSLYQRLRTQARL